MKVCINTLLVCFILAVLLVSMTFTQEQENNFRDMIKKQLKFEQWIPMLKARPEMRYKPFKLDNVIVSPWKIVRIREIGEANSGMMTRYILVKETKEKEKPEIVRVSITQCNNRKQAMEGLIDHLTGVQRPDMQLIENKEKIIGDLTVNMPGETETAIYFIRGNLLITLENASKKPTADLRKLSITIDQYLIRLMK